jgi:hypothetical protein
MRITGQQVLRLLPEKGIEGIRPVIRAVGALPRKEAIMGAVPNVVGIRIEDGRGQTMLCRGRQRRTVKGGSRNQPGKPCQTLRADASAHGKSAYWGHGNSRCFAYSATKASSILYSFCASELLIAEPHMHPFRRLHSPRENRDFGRAVLAGPKRGSGRSVVMSANRTSSPRYSPSEAVADLSRLMQYKYTKECIFFHIESRQKTSDCEKRGTMSLEESVRWSSF